MDRILVPIDESEQSLSALEIAFERFPDGEILVLHVVQVTELPEDETESAEGLAIEDATEVREAAEAIAATQGRDIEFETTKGHAAKAIVSYAEENDVDRIVMDSSERSGVRRFLLGSVGKSVEDEAPCPVTLL